MTELNLPLEAQLRGFLLAAVAGVLLGALYDVLRVYRILFRPPKGLVFALDVFTLCAAAIVTFLTALAASRGVLRFYLFLGEAAGWLYVYLFMRARWVASRFFWHAGCCACLSGWFFALYAACAVLSGRQRAGPAGGPGFVEKNRAAPEKSLET